MSITELNRSERMGIHLERESVSCSVMSRLFCPWHSPGKNTGVGCDACLQGDLPKPGIEPGSPTLQADS